VNDPDMPDCVRLFWNRINAVFWRSIEEEVERKLEGAVLHRMHDSLWSPSELAPLSNPLMWLRAKILHHHMPHNKSFWGRLLDPVYDIMLLIQLIPFYSVRVGFFAVILGLHCCPGYPDQYQLLFYILQFKSTQFFTSGLIAMALGSMLYFRCYTFYKDDVLECIETDGPSRFAGGLVDFTGNVVLVWIAFFMLPWSTQRGMRVFGNKHYNGNTHRYGGRLCIFQARNFLARLMSWDVKAFILSMVSLILLDWVCVGDFAARISSSDPQLQANLYWVKVLYALLSLPFGVFNLPWATALITHLDRTGYREDGECVMWHIREDPVEAEAEKGLDPQPQAPEGNPEAAQPLLDDTDADGSAGWAAWLASWYSTQETGAS